MKKKLNLILLIDDNDADNYFHQIILKKMDIAKHIEVALNGEEALNFLKVKDQPAPELILLDINMPKMNGWEFLEAYKNLDIKEKTKITIVMLTTSENPEDRKKAEQIPEITGFTTKPLAESAIEDVLKKHFPEVISDNN
jgi:CheY-like chemotaxis protein